MKAIAIYERSAITISTIVLCVFLLTKCIDKKGAETNFITNANGEQFTGSSVCADCHKNIYASHINTVHYLSSQPAAVKYIKGSFETGKNVFAYDDSVKVAMEKRNDGFYQIEYLNNIEKRKERFDIVVGSGKKGQSYLYWIDSNLFQLPITYFTPAHQWSNSPGYPRSVVYDRPITTRCLECHITYAQKIENPDDEYEEFDHNKMIYGIDCEKCHGPAGKHVEFQLQNPNETKGKYIINPATFSRQQKLDMCILCHGGRLEKTKPSFGFEPGDKISDYFFADTASKKIAGIDVHGNQYGLLSASKCFRMSNMTCNSCHNPHENETGKLNVYSQRCMNCHNNEYVNPCKMTSVVGPAITQNCIDCHMPKQSSRSIVVQLQGEITPTALLMRTHLIKFYPDEALKVLDSTNKIKIINKPVSLHQSNTGKQLHKIS